MASHDQAPMLGGRVLTVRRVDREDPGLPGWVCGPDRSPAERIGVRRRRAKRQEGREVARHVAPYLGRRT